jgi:hypothetical protein
VCICVCGEGEGFGKASWERGAPERFDGAKIASKARWCVTMRLVVGGKGSLAVWDLHRSTSGQGWAGQGRVHARMKVSQDCSNLAGQLKSATSRAPQGAQTLAPWHPGTLAPWASLSKLPR